MKQSTTILRGLNNIRESYILESELPDNGAVLLPQASPKSIWKRITSSGWFVAAVCTVVAFGTLAGIIWAGQQGAGVIDPIGTPTESTTEETTTKEPTEEPTEEILDPVTNFPVLTQPQKTVQRKYHNPYPMDQIYVLSWAFLGMAQKCPYTAEEVLSAVARGDNIVDIYERIGYPTYRDTSATHLSGRLKDYYFMIYDTIDGDRISIDYRLSGCNEDDYCYVVTSISSSKDTIPYTKMDFDTKVRLQVIPVFMAVEQVGVNYLLEKEIITPYEATLYAEEEAFYQAQLNTQDETE